MLVPTLPEARYLILDDADLPSLVAVALAAERWGGGATAARAPAPVLVPAWWRPEADAAMPLVHAAVHRHAALYEHQPLPEELVVEPTEPAGTFPQLSDLLLTATRLAARMGCDAVLFPFRAADLAPDARLDPELIAREVDRAALITRLASLDSNSGTGCSVITPLIDFDDEQLIDLARDLAVPAEQCWWSTAPSDPAARHAADRWRAVRAMPAGPAPSRVLTRTA